MEEESMDNVDDAGLDTATVSEAARSKELERQRLQDEINQYLASGGKIDRIPANVVADPPKKPESNYGGQPI